MIIEEGRDRGGTKETTGKKYGTLSILFLLCAGYQIWLKLVTYTLLAHKVEFFYKNALRQQREDIFAQWRKKVDKNRG